MSRSTPFLLKLSHLHAIIFYLAAMSSITLSSPSMAKHRRLKWLTRRDAPPGRLYKLIITFPHASTFAVAPGITTVLEMISSMMHGPFTTFPGCIKSRS